MFGPDGMLEKLIIFTEHRDTLRYLTNKIRSLLGREEAVVTIHGGLLRDERRKVEELFKQDKDVRILIATDAAGEGINLQRAHLMVNYDLPQPQPHRAAFWAHPPDWADRGLSPVQPGFPRNP
ncbi:MAG: C-terminal helicase domain-containing protein [Candidatus Syntrophopropionicum ammoniitolerans]